MDKYTPHRYAKEHNTNQQEIADYMNATIWSVDSQATISEAAQLMDEKKIGSLLVKVNENYEGIITESDLTRRAVAKGLDPHNTKVSSVMTQPICSMDCHEPVTKANSVMASNKVRHLAITDDDKIVGILSVKDVVSFFSNPRLR
ncbi:MAG: cyclic nucleotide-binding/CBS domain-containing protein [Nitrospinales bacterium]